MVQLIISSPAQTISPRDIWSAWNLQLSLLAPLAVITLVYAWGAYTAWRHAGMGRGLRYRYVLSFVGAVLSLLIALVSPLDEFSGELFTAHMLQHLILILVSAPLLVGADLPMALAWALPRRLARSAGQRLVHTPAIQRVWRVLSHPVSAWLWFTLALWLWHAPVFFEAALRSEGIHTFEHLAFITTAILFWWALFKQSARGTIQYGVAIPYLFTTELQSAVLGALMTFTTQAWYPYYAARVSAWGLTPLQDQQLAGLIMWIPGGVVFTALTIAYFAAWFHALEVRSLQISKKPGP